MCVRERERERERMGRMIQTILSCLVPEHTLFAIKNKDDFTGIILLTNSAFFLF